MSLKTILGILFDADEAAFPQFKFLFDIIRPYVTANLPADDGVVVMGETAAAPESVKQAVTDFLNGLIAHTSRPLVKVGLRVLVSLLPSLIDMAWDSLFPGQAKPVMALVRPDPDAILLACDCP